MIQYQVSEKNPERFGAPATWYLGSKADLCIRSCVIRGKNAAQSTDLLGTYLEGKSETLIFISNFLVVLQKQVRIAFATHFYFHTVQLQSILNDGQSISFSFQNSLCVNLMFTK